MKKQWILAVFAVAMALVLAGCGGASSSAPAADASIAPAESTSESAAPAGDAGGQLVMATEATFPPYEYVEGSEIVGVDVDIANEIAKELGMELVIEDMPFNSLITAISSGKADFAAAGLSVTEERKEQVDFSIEYATSKQVILTKADSGITGEAGLDGKTVGVQMATVADLALTDDYPNVTVERYDRYTDAVNELMNGRVDALVLDSLPAERFLAQNDGLVICDEALFTDVYAIAVQKGNTELLDAINTVLTRLMDEGKIEEYTANHLDS